MTSSAAEPIRVGLLGYGVAGAVFHAPLLAADPRFRLDAVVTASPKRQQQVRVEHPDTRVLDTPEQLWASAGELDLAVVATPNRSHVELTSAALDVGLGVVVDKPFTPTAAEGRNLIERARSAGRLLTVFQNRRWDNDFRTLRALLERDALGAVRRFESRFERWVPTAKPGWRERGGPDEAGGVLNDLGSHLVDQALTLFGPVASVYAESDRRRSGVEVDDDTFVALTHVNGVRSHLWTSKVAPRFGPRMRVLGDRAAFTKHGLDPQEAALRAGGRPGDLGWGEEPGELWGTLGAGDEVETIASDPGCYEVFYAELADAVRAGTPPPVDPEESVAGLVVLEAARRSAESGEVQHLR
ncbi:oxidoreductase [Allosaccharopolyspora coralli]|uniref:Oxidoreductase n=1 Tax=Allosaccharopolyspora coralli TaxID=2665642 RepID=A0A5Q3QDJ2_9PSEU|nr:Gfo/Idh/MocA family oxidoreductase [Allosaccharopolyspora coralli]QGK69555.1 oxidoreductase [Allosaccharopolyspora coralli]